MKFSVSGKLNDNAGTIDVTLQDNAGTVIIAGSHQGVLDYKTNREEYIELLAVGGDGEDGLIGKDGAKGQPGDPGRDATRVSDGTDGKPGGDGEPGEEGTHGKPAGNGGCIRVGIDGEQLALLSLLKTNVSPGNPGKEGQHGKGGEGGQGGAGGNSYSWSVPYTSCRTEYDTDPQGKTTSRVVHDVTYITEFRRGGYDGPSGQPGKTYTYPLYPGQPGQRGEVYFLVSDGMQTIVHREPFQLTVENINFLSPEQSGLFEPGETITANYRLNNIGSTMNSPWETTLLTLKDPADLEYLQWGEVTGPIAPGASNFTSTFPLIFKIKYPSGPTTQPYKQKVDVTVAAYNTRVQRFFPGVVTTDQLLVQYPVELESSSKTIALARGESWRLKSTAKNISKKAVGSQESRGLSLQISFNGPDPEGVFTDVDYLGPGQTTSLERVVQFADQAEEGAQLQFLMNLYLQPIDRDSYPNLIQQQPVTIQLTPRYQVRESKFLLVINGETTSAAYKYWVDQLSKLAGDQAISIWNISYYHSFLLDNRYNESPSLLENMAEGTVVILDNVFSEGKENKQRQASQDLTQLQLLKASQDYDVSLIVVGDNNKLPQPIAADEQREEWTDKFDSFESVDSLITNLFHEKNLPEAIRLHKVQVHLRQSSFFTSAISAENQAEKIRTALAKTFPNRCYHVAICKETVTDDQAIIAVRRLADPLGNSCSQLKVSEQELKEPQQTSSEPSTALITALPFSQKLRLFTQAKNNFHDQLATALTQDLTKEHDLLQQIKRYGAWWQLLSKCYLHDFNAELKKLNQLVHCLQNMAQHNDFTSFNEWSPLVIQMIAHVQCHAEQYSTFWSRIVHWFIAQTNELIKQSSFTLCQQVLTTHSAITKVDLADLQEKVELQMRRIKCEEKLAQFIVQKEGQLTAKSALCLFFSSCTPAVVQAELAAARQIQQIYDKNQRTLSLDNHMTTINKNKELKKLLAEFELIYAPSITAPIEKDLINVYRGIDCLG